MFFKSFNFVHSEYSILVLFSSKIKEYAFVKEYLKNKAKCCTLNYYRFGLFYSKKIYKIFKEIYESVLHGAETS